MSSIGGAGITAGLYAVVSNPAQVAAQPEDAKDKAHHLKNGKGYRNPWESHSPMAPLNMLRTLAWRRLSGQQNTPDTTPPTVPVCTPTFLPTRETPKLRATWMGHACFYVEFPGGLRVLFDPVFEDCCAPVNIKSLRRYTPPPCEIEDLPIVDAVVISHSHYDHLSYPTTQRISKAFPSAHFFVPLGNKKWFNKCGITQVTELDWWESRELALQKSNNPEKDTVSVSSSPTAPDQSQITATISALPCQHTSARTPFDRDSTLWASWSVHSGSSSVYFAGDTGYRSIPYALSPTPQNPNPDISHLPHCPAFAQIGKLRGPFDLGLIPIGAYEPRWLFSAVHADPGDAVEIFRDTACKSAVGMHWGTWVLTEEEVREPPKKLAEACKALGVEEGRFGVLDIGGTWEGS